IAGLVYVESLGGGQLTGEYLQRHGGDQRLEEGRHRRHLDERVRELLHLAVTLVGDHDDPGTTGPDLLNVGHELVVQHTTALGGWHHDHDRHPFLDERDRPVLELAGGEALGVHVGEFLELERSLKRDRVTNVPSEEQDTTLVGQLAGQGPDRLHGLEYPLHLGWHLPEMGDLLPDLVVELRTPYLGQVEPDQVAADKLGEERLGGRDGDLRASVRVDHRVTLARDGRAVHVADAEHP